MKFLHMADCHLDSAMEAHLPVEVARRRRRELLSTFSAALRLAKEENVRAVLIAGDLFDVSAPASKTVRYVIDSCAAMPETDFIVIEGNHDTGALAGASLPINFHLVPGGENAVFTYDDTVIYAAGYPVTEEYLTSLAPQEDKTNVLLLHGSYGKGAHTDGERLPEGLLENRHIDILALGHYHAFRSGPLPERGVWCYAGVPEGRGFDETGACGVVLWDTAVPGNPDFRPIAQRTLHRLTLDISSLHTEAEIEQAALVCTKDIPDSDMVHLTLSGEYRAEDDKDPEKLAALLARCFYFAKVKDKTRLAIHAEDYAHDVSLRGEFVRRVLGASLPPEERDRVLLYGLRALAGEEPTYQI